MQDIRLQKMRSTISRLGGISFHFENEPTGEWAAESTNIKGILTGGSSFPSDIDAAIQDAIFTYFEIPAHLCNHAMLERAGKTVKIKERAYV